MDVRDAIGPAPPWRIPGNAVMLVNDEVKFLLPAIPLPGFQDRRAHAAATDDFNALNRFLARRAGKIILVPFVPGKSTTGLLEKISRL